MQSSSLAQGLAHSPMTSLQFSSGSHGASLVHSTQTPSLTRQMFRSEPEQSSDVVHRGIPLLPEPPPAEDPLDEPPVVEPPVVPPVSEPPMDTPPDSEPPIDAPPISEPPESPVMRSLVTSPQAPCAASASNAVKETSLKS